MCYQNLLGYPVNSVSSGWCYPPFEQLGPDVEKLLFSPGIFLPADC